MYSTKPDTLWTRAARAAVLMIAFAASAVASATGPGDEMRVSESKYFAGDARDQETPDRVSTDSNETPPPAEKATRGSKQRQQSVSQSQAPNTDFWFYTADVELFADDDRDGYYHGIDLLFDADTVYTRADVYAVVYLSLEGGPWIEYAETETFAIYGATSDDDYVIVTELLAGYPTGSYDILIELFDTWDDSFVADFGPDNTSELGFLPLEDADRDAPFISSTPVVVNRGGGGAQDWLALAALGLLALSAAIIRRRAGRAVAVRNRCLRGPSA